MKRDGATRRLMAATRDGTHEMPRRKRDEQKRKEQKLLETATEIAIEQYGPALKELEKH